jgi:N-acetylmuramoyl-L-alanine amidase
MKDLCVYLDAGHGALDRSGNYVTAPSKQFEHSQGTFHKGRWFYEGVWNRTLTNRVAQKLWNLRISYLIVSHEYLDTPLQTRTDMANWYHRNYKEGIFISNHANASGANARGFEIYTTPGKTASDELAEVQWSNVQALLGDRITYRPDLSDGDHDRESNFFVLRNTVMPAILNEHLFFDQFQDATLLMNDDIVDRFAEAQVRTVIQWFNR